jgi:uncharacterized protein YbjT (DUF2867 family)
MSVALLAGATGLVGQRVLRLLLADGAFTRVVALARRPLSVTDQKLSVELVPDFSRLDDRPAPAATVALCALGTTIKQAGSQEAFRAVDHDAVVAFARWAARAGCQTFVLVSSVGADAGAGTFYLQVKGQAEESVAALGFRRFIALRPSLILGERQERRFGEAAAQALMPALSPLLLGPLRRYRGITGDQVAAAMITAARDQQPGREIWEHDRLVAAAA